MSHDTVPGVVVMMVANRLMATGWWMSSGTTTQAGCGRAPGDSTSRATVKFDTTMSHSTRRVRRRATLVPASALTV